MGRRVSIKMQNTWPVVQEIELYWIDKRYRVEPRKLIRPGKQRFSVQRALPRGTVFNPGVCRKESRDVDQLLAWVEARRAEGWINILELQEQQELMRRLIRKARSESFKAPDPEKTAGIKKSGKGEKPRRKPQLDRRMPDSVRNNGTVIGTRIKGVWGS
jgi:hypothetical protein